MREHRKEEGDFVITWSTHELRRLEKSVKDNYIRLNNRNVSKIYLGQVLGSGQKVVWYLNIVVYKINNNTKIT